MPCDSKEDVKKMYKNVKKDMKASLPKVGGYVKKKKKKYF